MKRLKEDDDYDEDESIDAAVDERKFLLQRMLTYAVVMDNSDTDVDHEQQLYIVMKCQMNMVNLVYVASSPKCSWKKGCSSVVLDYVA